MLSETQVRKVRPLHHPRKLSDGGGLYLLVAPNGGRYWRFNYRFGGKNKTLALGVYPDVPLAKARERHQAARHHLAEGFDPSVVKKANGKHFGFAAQSDQVKPLDLDSALVEAILTRVIPGKEGQR